MWGEVENYHADLGGPEYHLVSGWKGNWRRFTRSHIGHKDRFCLVAELDWTAVGFLLGAILVRPRVRAPIVRTHLRLVCRSGPTESGSRGIACESGARVVPVASRRKGRFVRAHAERDRLALLEENGIRADRPHLGSSNLTACEAIGSRGNCNLKQG